MKGIDSMRLRQDMEHALKKNIADCLYDFTDTYASAKRRDSYPYVLTVMRKALQDILGDVLRQMKEDPEQEIAQEDMVW